MPPRFSSLANLIAAIDPRCGGSAESWRIDIDRIVVAENHPPDPATLDDGFHHEDGEGGAPD